MQKQGTIIKWDAARGFGFLRAPATSADVFFHIKDWTGGAERPVEGMSVVYEEIHVGGKGPRGMAVRPRSQPAAAPARKGTRRTATGQGDGPVAPMLTLMLAYAAVLAWATVTKRLPTPVVLAVPLLSAIAFIAYWFDKQAALHGRWRTPEQTLHLLSLAGGWPGAWLGQKLLRHKSRKASFRWGYWATVAVHWAALVGFLGAFASR